jgi:hypothetical protein
MMAIIKEPACQAGKGWDGLGRLTLENPVL